MDELQLKITDELAAVTAFLEQRLGRRSRWNGEVELRDDEDSYSKAFWSGTIVINRTLAYSKLRWRTELHEALPLFSVGLSVGAYLNLSGWEEGVVEQLQRTLRGHIFPALGFDISANLLETAEADHQYNRYISALETIRGSLHTPKAEFYEGLLAQPLKERPASVITAGCRLPAEEFAAFQRTFALAFSTLRGD